jgi:predicted RNA-binding Zn-ribbon protein involved in translation (DUF1610 family)
MTHQPELMSEPKTPEQTARAAARDAEREAYLEKLRQHLQDPEFRAIEGFPIGEDEDILALSDPPYYTACPNPFLPEIIKRWQAERVEIRAELGLPDDSDDNGNGGEPVYHREPFAADVSEGKRDPLYTAISLHTKVPHKAIMRYIVHYTDPGDIVLDGFCGSGMTGIAAQMCSCPDREFKTQIEADLPNIRWGIRRAIMCDLSPIAALIAHTYNTPHDVRIFTKSANQILKEVKEECSWMYETKHTGWSNREKDVSKHRNSAISSTDEFGFINYTVWSDIFLCPECGEQISFWRVAVDVQTGKILDEFPCPGCGVILDKNLLQRAWEKKFDKKLGATVEQAKQEPVLIRYFIGKTRFEKFPDEEDIALIERVHAEFAPYDFPLQELPQGYNTEQPKQSHDVTHVHQFFSERNLWTLSALRSRFNRFDQARLLLDFTFLSSFRIVSRRSIFLPWARVKGGTGPFKPSSSGNLYIPSISGERNVIVNWKSRISTIKRTFGGAKFAVIGNACVTTQSTTDLNSLPTECVDYIFTDPPFGANIMYSELNFIGEAWLGVRTNSRKEAIVNDSQRKGLPEYQELMVDCFKQYYRVLKSGRWMTVEFHNSQNSVWNTIQEALLRAGFVVADVRTLDKKQATFKQHTSTSAVKQDLVISAYKPRSGFERRFLAQAGSAEGAWDFVRQHLDQLPVVVESPSPAGGGAGGGGSTLEVVAERQAYLLYDRMVAFHIQRGFSVPMGAAEFYAGLKQRFPERDGMYFLPTQVAEYDRRRMQASRVEQLALFVTDEKSAIQWLRQALGPETGSGPQTYQDLQPKFLRELHQARHEDLPELSEMLEQNFLQDAETDRWYAPDPGRQEDLEKLRERALLREFQAYATGQGRLKVFRTEAVRAGFKHAWHARDYRLIVQVAERLPTSVLQEDSALLMYYDNALMRAESEPEQGQLS